MASFGKRFLFEFLGDNSLEISIVFRVWAKKKKKKKIKEKILNINDYLLCFDIAD